MPDINERLCLPVFKKYGGAFITEELKQKYIAQGIENVIDPKLSADYRWCLEHAITGEMIQINGISGIVLLSVFQWLRNITAFTIVILLVVQFFNPMPFVRTHWRLLLSVWLFIVSVFHSATYSVLKGNSESCDISLADLFTLSHFLGHVLLVVIFKFFFSFWTAVVISMALAIGWELIELAGKRYNIAYNLSCESPKNQIFDLIVGLGGSLSAWIFYFWL